MLVSGSVVRGPATRVSWTRCKRSALCAISRLQSDVYNGDTGRLRPQEHETSAVDIQEYSSKTDRDGRLLSLGPLPSAEYRYGSTAGSPDPDCVALNLPFASARPELTLACVCTRPRLCENAIGGGFSGSFYPWRGRENRSWLDLERRCSFKQSPSRVFTQPGSKSANSSR